MDFLSRVVDWLREGYPAGIPAQDTIPVLALLRRRLTDAEVVAVAEEMARLGLLPADVADVGSQIMLVTDELPHPQDLERVFAHLSMSGFPTHDED